MHVKSSSRNTLSERHNNQSCNHYIYNIADKLGPRPIIEMARKLKLDQLSGLEQIGTELNSFIPTPEWKLKNLKTRWYLADTLNLSFGQGYVAVTPMILSNLISRLLIS